MPVDVLIFTGVSFLEFARPAGAYRIATELRQSGYTVQVVDTFPFMAEENFAGLQKVISKFVGLSTLWVGFSSTFFLRRDALRVVKNDSKSDLDSKGVLLSAAQSNLLRQQIKALSPRSKVVVGGAKAFQRGFGEFADVYIEGYADTSVIKFTDYLKGKNPFFQFEHDVSGSMIIAKDPKAASFDFVNSKIEWHPSDHVATKEALSIEVSRGCIFSCSFCSYPLNGKNKIDYLKESSVLLDELVKNYETYGTTTYIYSDDTHNDSVEKLESLYNNVYSKLPFKISFVTYLRLDLLVAKPQMVALLKESGLIGCFFGIESLNYESAKAIGKGLRPEKALDMLLHLREIWGNHVTTSAGFIVGLPNESEQSARKWLDSVIAKDFPIDTSHIYPLIMSKPIHAATKSWKSDFESNPERAGYSFGSAGWINNTGLTFFRSQEIVTEYFKKDVATQGKKIGAFGIPGFMNLGFNRQEISDARLNNPVFIKETVRRRKLLNSKYLENILSYSGTHCQIA
jgi:tRNA A37 methylthiotransferase MiaB